MTGDAEIAALTELVNAAPSPSREAVVALGIALASPWRGDRRDLRDRPTKFAPTSDGELQQFMRTVRGKLGEPLPTDRGPLAWLRWSGLARPIDSLDRVPAWLASDALTGGWACLPPRSGLRPDTSMLAADGRLAMLALLAGQCSTPPSAAIETIADWIAGPHCTTPSTVMAEQCPAMTISPGAFRAWWMSSGVLPVATIVEAVEFGLPADQNWTVPPPTAAELAAETQAAEIMRQHAINDAKWKARPKAEIR